MLRQLPERCADHDYDYNDDGNHNDDHHRDHGSDDAMYGQVHDACVSRQLPELGADHGRNNDHDTVRRQVHDARMLRQLPHKGGANCGAVEFGPRRGAGRNGGNR